MVALPLNRSIHVHYIHQTHNQRRDAFSITLQRHEVVETTSTFFYMHGLSPTLYVWCHWWYTFFFFFLRYGSFKRDRRTTAG